MWSDCNPPFEQSAYCPAPRKTTLDMGPIFPGYFGGIPGYEADKCLKCTHTHRNNDTDKMSRSKNIKTGLCSVFMLLETPASGWLCSLEKILCEKIVAGKTRWIMIHLDRKYRLTNPQGRLPWIWPISHFPWIFSNPWIPGSHYQSQGNPGWLVTLILVLPPPPPLPSHPLPSNHTKKSKDGNICS